MLTFLRSAAMAFSMFSVIRVPAVEWKKENMRWMFCVLPLVGAVIGGLMLAWTYLSSLLGIGDIFRGAVLVLISAGVSGGIHLDGFADTSDALASHAEPARRREILKDSHAGAFAVIAVCVYLLLYFASAASVRHRLMLLFAPMLARSTGALASVLLPATGTKGLLSDFRDGASAKAGGVLLIWCVLLVSAMILIFPLGGALSALACGLLFLNLKRIAARGFGGMSGDLAGFLIAQCELFILMMTVLAEGVMTL